MEFKDLKVGDPVYILENSGTFRKTTTFNVGHVISIGNPYDDNTVGNPYSNLILKKKIIDITISCEGLQKKLTVGAEKVSITDATIGLTVSTDKEELITLINNQYKEYLDKIASIKVYRLEADKCKSILDLLYDKPNKVILDIAKDTPTTEVRLSTETIRVS